VPFRMIRTSPACVDYVPPPSSWSMCRMPRLHLATAWHWRHRLESKWVDVGVMLPRSSCRDVISRHSGWLQDHAAFGSTLHGTVLAHPHAGAYTPGVSSGNSLPGFAA